MASARRQSASSSSADEGEENFPKSCLKAHNIYRNLHNIQPLKLSKRLCNYAQEWADKLAKDDQMSHRPDPTYGENVFSLWASESTRKVKGKEPVESWYKEIKDHVFGAEPNDTKTGHFAQLVWRDTKLLGVGISKSSSGKHFVVCNYDPPGNFVGEYMENVPPPLSAMKPPIINPKPDLKKKSKKKKKTKTPEEADEESVSEAKRDECVKVVEVETSKETDKASASEVKGYEKAKIETSDENFLSPVDRRRFAKECLAAHNECRRKHCVVELTLEPMLCKYAQDWASRLAEKDEMSHRAARKYGENIYCYFSNIPDTIISGKDPVDVWYKEMEQHEFNKEPIDTKTGHFTQIVWKDTLRLGTGIAKSKSGRFYVVANYDPPGNYVGEFRQCVAPSGGATQKNRPSVKQGPLASSKVAATTPLDSRPEKKEALIIATKPPTSSPPKLPSNTNEEKKVESIIPKDSPPVSRPKTSKALTPPPPSSAPPRKPEVSAVIPPVIEQQKEVGAKDMHVAAENETALKPTVKKLESEGSKKGEHPQEKSVDKKATESLPLSAKNNVPLTKDKKTSSSPALLGESRLERSQSKSMDRQKMFLKQDRVEEIVTGEIFTEFQMNCLNAHNMYREEHGVGTLALSSELCSRAADWAEHLASIDKLESRNDPTLGENLYSYWSSNANHRLKGNEAASSWYNEIDTYDFSAVDDVAPKAGNFTQMVWKSSTRMGVAVARSTQGRFYVVANYDPYGNVLGKYRENVLPKGKEEREKIILAVFEKSGFDKKAFDDECLAKHNAYRIIHGAAPLRTSKKISKYAQAWADQLATSDTTIYHRKERKYGENIYSLHSVAGKTTEVTGTQPVVYWYNEIKEYTFGKEPNNLKAGHFTQVVWKSTESLGVGVAWSDSGRLYVVCNYDPPGNYIGSFYKNVLPLGWKDQDSSSSASSDDEEDQKPIPLKDFLTPAKGLDTSTDDEESKKNYVLLAEKVEAVKQQREVETKAEISQTIEEFSEECLRLHNHYRELHQVAPLELDTELSKKAAKHALELASIEFIKPYSNADYGENVFTRWSSKGKAKLTAKEVVSAWYDEGKKFTFGAEPATLTSGHFSQLVWKKSYHLGVGRATSSKTGRIFVVALYDPPGNYKGYFQKNVLEPLKENAQSEC